MRFIRAMLPLAAIFVSGSLPAAEKKPQVTLEVITEQGGSLTGAQEWSKLLGEAGLSNVRIHSSNEKVAVAIEKQGPASAPSYKVTGILKSDNSLQLPGGKFTLRDKGPLKQWLAKIGDAGVEGVTQKPSAFGLLPSQLEQVHDDLKRPVDFDTKQLAATEAVSKLGGRLKFALKFDAVAAQALADVKVEEDLRGLSSGTALAAILRPAGLVLEPERHAGGEMAYRIAKPSEREFWPVGWLPEEPARKVLPDMFELLNVEIDATPLHDALAALQERLKAPYLFDQNALAFHGIDPSQVEVSVPGKRMSYSLVQQKILSQAKLKGELRVDEAGKPFFWITTIKPAK